MKKKIDEAALIEQRLTEKTVYQGRIFDVQEWSVRLPNGKEAPRDVILHNGAAAVVPVDAAGNVTLVYQHRVAVGRVTLEIPAGKLDGLGEDPLDCARRELREETGLAAREWRHLVTLEPTPAYCTERIAIYLATGLTSGRVHPDEDEFLLVESLPLSEALAKCMRGEIRDSKTLSGLLLAGRVLGINPSL